MKRYYARDFGIKPQEEIAERLAAAIDAMRALEGTKELVFDEGVYFFDADKVARPILHITNTMAANEWEDGETICENRVAIYLKDIDGLTLDGGGSEFVMRGQTTNAAVCNCKEIVFKNMTFSAINPDMHEFEVIKKGAGYVDFRLDGESKYEKRGSNFRFVGQGYSADFFGARMTAHWIGKIPFDDPNALMRVSHPFMRAISICETSQNVFRVRYIFPPNFHVGDAFYLFDVRRKFQGVFVDDCVDVALVNVKQHFNYGLAFVAQNTENVTVDGCAFRPKDGSAKKMASVADFMQICACRGRITVKNSYFEGAGDDALNVHGIHFKIKQIDGKVMTISFCHGQSYGFCPFRNGDVIKYVAPDTLMPYGLNAVEDAALIDEKTIRLVLRDKIDAKVSDVIENKSACPDLLYENNVVNRIITRGLLITTSGKVVVSKNNFKSTSMHSVLIADDAKNWFESGNTEDVTIEGNTFGRCRGYTVIVKPENTRDGGFVHNNIRIKGNVIDSKGEGGFSFKSAGAVTIENNRIIGKTHATRSRHSHVETDVAANKER